jgi:hypothetical protein
MGCGVLERWSLKLHSEETRAGEFEQQLRRVIGAMTLWHPAHRLAAHASSASPMEDVQAFRVRQCPPREERRYVTSTGRSGQCYILLMEAMPFSHGSVEHRP